MLKDLVGDWSGHNSLWFQPGTPVFESHTQATVSLVAAGKVTTLDYTWSHEGDAHDGRLLVAVDDATGDVQMAWCDSFHMDAKLLILSGTMNGQVVAATGAYTIPGSEAWGWRIELEPQGASAFQMRMFNILPVSMGGVEALAVQADYVRS